MMYLTEDELRTHLSESGDPSPQGTIEAAQGNRSKEGDTEIIHPTHTESGTIYSDPDGTFWLETH